MMNRRRFITRSVQASLATATSAFWGNSLASRAFAQSVGSTYKAIVVITLNGGNDANNLLVPLDPTEYAEYSQMRGTLALPISSLIALNRAAHRLTECTLRLRTLPLFTIPGAHWRLLELAPWFSQRQKPKSSLVKYLSLRHCCPTLLASPSGKVHKPFRRQQVAGAAESLI